MQATALIRRATLSGPRNLELVLLVTAIGFAYLGWQALDTAAFTLPADTQRILTQFGITALAGHLALRVACPEAPAQPYAIAMMLSAIGLVFVIRLAPEQTADQVNWISVGTFMLLAGVIAGYRYETLRRYKYTAALGALALLFLTGIIGDTINGARLWITLGGYSIQTTEFIKVGLVIFLAGYLADQASVLSMPSVRFGGRTYSALPYLLPLIVTWFAMIAALALLRDLGSVALLLGLAAAAIYVATGRRRYLVGSVGLLVLTGAAGYLLFDHAQLRIDTWLDPFAAPQGAGFQTAQSTFAIQAGGITGEGLGMGQPTVIPAAPTDYVYSAVAEELGLLGALGIVALFGLLVVAGLRVALRARDNFGALLASSIALLIGIQALVIIGGNLRLIPTTGITLPLVSYGGSSVVVNLLLLGILLGIAQKSLLSPRED